MRVLLTFEAEIPESEVSEMNDVYYEAWKAVRDAGPCWPGLHLSLKFLNEQGEQVGRTHQ